jgi:hypothetical protein
MVRFKITKIWDKRTWPRQTRRKIYVEIPHGKFTFTVTFFTCPLTLSLSKFTDSLSLKTYSLSLSFSPALPLPGRSAVLHRIPSLSLSLSGTPSSRPVGRPCSPDSVSTGRHLSLSRPYFTGEKHSLSSPQPTVPLHRQGPFSTGKVAFPFFFLTEGTTFFFVFLFIFIFFPFFCFFNRRHDLLLPMYIYIYFFSVFLTKGTTFFFLFFLKKKKKNIF